MKTYTHLFETMLSDDAIITAALEASKHKLCRQRVYNSLMNIDKTISNVRACIEDPDWHPPDHTPHRILDGANGKERDIVHPQFCPEQIWHHALMAPLTPIILGGMYEQTYGCRPPQIYRDANGKRRVRRFGPQAAAKRLTKWAQCGKKLYVAELDVHHAYQSADLALLREKLARVIQDKRYLLEMDKLLNGCSDGLPLGYFPSPWLWNFYLKDFDHYVAGLGAQYLRYADNLFLLCTNKRKLRRIVESVELYLNDELHLQLKHTRQIYRFEYIAGRDADGKPIYKGRAIDALGYVVHCDRLTVRGNDLLRSTRKARRLDKKQHITWYDASGMLSELGWTKHTDCREYVRKHILTRVSPRRLRRKVSAHSKATQKKIMQRRRDIYDNLEKRNRLAGGKAC